LLQHKVGAPYNDAYTASKFALEGVMESIVPLVARFGVKATIFEPGPVATDVMAPRRRERLIAPESVRDNPYVEPWTFLERTIANTGARANRRRGGEGRPRSSDL
jgi:NAD(P)-dependent dehydrogenase (short-subunit alcohol dehydrogenase family)